MTNATNSQPHRHFFKLWWSYTAAGGWTEYRRLSTAEVAWFQRIFEAWWILLGQHSLEKAYRSGVHKARTMRGET